MLWSFFLCSLTRKLRWETIVCFVDYSRIVNHHCWNSFHNVHIYYLKMSEAFIATFEIKSKKLVRWVSLVSLALWSYHFLPQVCTFIQNISQSEHHGVRVKIIHKTFMTVRCGLEFSTTNGLRHTKFEFFIEQNKTNLNIMTNSDTNHKFGINKADQYFHIICYF